MPTMKRVEIKAHQHLKEMLRLYFDDLEAASHDAGRRVAWCTSVGPCEILAAFGFAVFFPENHGAMLGAKKMAAELIPYAVGAGYSAETCSYMNCDIGSALTGRSPLTDVYGMAGPPTPDLLVYNTNQCREVQDWFGWFSRKHDAPSLGIMPPRCLGAVTKDHIAFVKHELELLIQKIESQFGVTMDHSKLEESVALSSRASTLWREVLDTAQHQPAAISFWDGLIQMSPVILMRGSQTAIDYYELLLAEMQQRVADGVGAVPGERWRLYWDGMPVWPRIRDLSEKFQELRTVIAASTYCNSWAFEPYEGGDPLEWMARTSLEIFINRDEEYKQQFLTEMIQQFSIDGAIFHNARTCPNNTNSRFGMVERLRQSLDIPVLVIDGDLSDARFFSTAQTMTNVEAFIEQLEERRR
ncbi:MAG: 2-hydroxyacyl-CoA dehydratase [Planctomycetes bacterium]|nr:2-hydroxyacyl-CoA dehydratase [Planctomycetota bacterium]NOG53707.1 2-hydroxyacyl-CoA dehydratase [Planctomycetota bacterium]